jgi:hypothetical protein
MGFREWELFATLRIEKSLVIYPTVRQMKAPVIAAN